MENWGGKAPKVAFLQYCMVQNLRLCVDGMSGFAEVMGVSE